MVHGVVVQITTETVLPFTSVSMDADNEFFANGVHDDLLTRLAQLESLRVISRTSVLEFKNTVRNIREIGARLGADVILEGGIQSAGATVERIGAGLYVGRNVGLQLLGKPEGNSAFDEPRFQTRPLYRGKPWFLASAVRYYQLLDRLR